MRVSLAIETEDADKYARAVETIARAMAGLTLDGIDATMYSYPTLSEEEDNE